jgi:uncharacterized protein involved in exopolysaccharide biosynthesis
MSFEQQAEYWLNLVIRRRVLVMHVFVTCFGLIAIFSFLWPPVYESTAKVLVQPNRAQLLVSPGFQEGSSNQPSAVANPVTEEDLNSETELLSNRYLLERTVERTKGVGETQSLLSQLVATVMSLPERGYDAIHGLARPPTDEQLALILSKKLHVSVIRRSNILEISFRSHNAAWSQAFLAHLIDEYLELHALISHDPKAEKFFRGQSELLRKRLQQSEDQLRAMQLQTGITDFEAQKQQLVTQLYALRAQENKASSDFAAASEQAASLEKQLAAAPKNLTRRSVVQNMALEQLKPLVLQLEAQRAELLSRYKPSSEKIRGIDAQLAASHKILDRENHAEMKEQTTDLNPVWITIDTNLETARALSASLKASDETLLRQIAESESQLTALAGDGLLVSRKQREVDANKEAYLSYLRKGEEARAAEALNQSKILNVSVVEPPNHPIHPKFPVVMLNLIAGLFLGIGIGVAAAFWEERYDQKLYSAAEVGELSAVPVVATVSDRY